MDAPSPAQWAHLYSRAGWRTFPIWPGKKNPIYDGWQSGATTDPALIDRYWADPTRNMAVVCGEAFDAWDIEVEHVDAFATWMKLHDYYIPETPIAATGRGGIHILTQPTGVEGTRYLYLNGVHIGELKSKGGYILVCPSVTEQQYTWTWFPNRLQTCAAPDWLMSLVRRPEKPKAAVPWRQVSLSPQTDILPLVGAVRASVPGDRNAVLHWAANRACDDGIEQGFATRALMQAFIEISRSDENPQERAHEARATIASAYNR